MAVVAILVAGAVVAAGLVVSRSESDGSDSSSTATTAAPSGTPEDMFARAVESLEESHGFTYDFSGRWELDPFGSGETELITEDGTGEVNLPGEARHTVTADDGSQTELIIIGDDTWGRSSAFPDQIEQRPWADFNALDPLGARAFDPSDLVEWLEEATDHREGGQDGQGRTVVHAEVPPHAMPPAALDLGVSDEQTLTSELEMTVDEALVPVRVAISATTQSAVVELVFDAIDKGIDQGVQPPTVDQIDATPFVNEEDIAVVQGTETIGLAGIPDGWFMVGATVHPDPSQPDCPQVELAYFGVGAQVDPTGGLDDYLLLHMVPAACEAGSPLLGAANFSAGEHDGFAMESPEGNVGAVHVGETMVAFISSLSLSDLGIVLATLGTVDLAAPPEGIEGIPSEPA